MTEPTPTTALQPSNHSLPEYRDLVLDEAETYGVDVADLRKDVNAADWTGEFDAEILDDALARLSDAGYYCVEENDSLLIYPPVEAAAAARYWGDGDE